MAVLALLREVPMHPYRMRVLLRERHKDEILALKRGSLYHAINRLLRDELIEVEGTGREGRRPERSTYRITAAGENALIRELRGNVATPRRESSDFMAAMSFLVHLDPADAVASLVERSQKLEGEIAGLSAGLEAVSGRVQRINLVESEYLLAMLRSELEWVRGLAADVREGKLDWNLKGILKGIHPETSPGSSEEGKQ